MLKTKVKLESRRPDNAERDFNWTNRDVQAWPGFGFPRFIPLALSASQSMLSFMATINEVEKLALELPDRDKALLGGSLD